MSSVCYENRKESFARCRALVLQAIHAKPGMTYMEIRVWIKKHKDFWMEGADARCRELYVLGHARREADEKGTIHVYPVPLEEFQPVWQNRGERAR